MDRLDGTDVVFSVNDQAFNVSGMGRSENLSEPVAENNDGAAEALTCVS